MLLRNTQLIIRLLTVNLLRLFKHHSRRRGAISLRYVTYALLVYGASEPELTTVQDFLDRCYKRRYIYARYNNFIGKARPATF